jgi:hypothetical protein
MVRAAVFLVGPGLVWVPSLLGLCCRIWAAGADANQKDILGLTPLHVAVTEGKVLFSIETVCCTDYLGLVCSRWH